MTVSESLRKVIMASNGGFAQLHISDEAALELASELAQMQFTPAISEAEIYLCILNGDTNFMDRPLLVADA